ncbi:NAD-dependent epimerase/dehydratase family protein [Wenxinia marina]|uniref:Nucleoside-diphosphate-sugar epimerase n=1 Tax=Wenxinia marina DSM 24838 TaxID=1123501 RepID=A0A0D0QEZ7_9RHOB|nr:NAD-dependent epimerase/dehydratase family protein [Wenxinia marina]KIQ70902.1 Nucleoside-diphosphate-sugar epimerase [Wenxinia marina DSM 24838]GGL56411.1 hypothetical protein GCM10011392_08600 [Wenxinia marina]
MGGLTILVTGGSGYLGRAVIAEGRQRGHRMRALVRKGDVPPGALAIRGDLFDRAALARACTGAEVVIHCASPLAGAEAELLRSTVDGTRQLMRAARQAGVGRVVLAGSLAIYGAGGLAPGSAVTEETPIEDRPQGRDAYTRAKLAQEETARDGRGKMGLWLLRMGAVWGPGRLWNAHLGTRLGPLLLRLGGTEGELPLLHRDHAAAALIAAAQTRPEGAEVLNLTDDDRPSAAAYLAALAGHGGPRLTLPLPWRLLDAAAALPLPRMPGLLRRPTLRARMMPLRYPNDRARDRLRWRPDTPFATLMEAVE